VLVCCWSPKGGSGTSVFSAACALTLAHDGGAVRLADLDGDQASILGLSSDPVTGLRDWLRVGIDAPVDAFERLSIPGAHRLTLLPAGRDRVVDVAPEVGAALGVALRDADVTTIVDVGLPNAPALEALLEVADATVVVLRSCYLALRRAVRMPATPGATGAVLVEDSGRALGARDVADVLGVPVLATVPVRASVARIVDAGVFPARLPDVLVRPAREVLSRLGCSRRRGRAA
jgi:hypothetical protein